LKQFFYMGTVNPLRPTKETLFWASIFLGLYLFCAYLLKGPEAHAPTFVLAIFLAWLSAWDITTGILPHRLTKPLLILGIIYHLITPGGDYQAALLGTILAFLFLWALNRLHKLVKGEDALGGGDIWLSAAGGAWLTFLGLGNMLFYTGLASIGPILFFAIKDKIKGNPGKTYMPLGPFLSSAIWLVWLIHPPIETYFTYPPFDYERFLKMAPATAQSGHLHHASIRQHYPYLNISQSPLDG